MSCGVVEVVPVHHHSVLLYVHRDVGTIRDGEPRKSSSIFTQLLSSQMSFAQILSFFIALCDSTGC